MLSESSRLVKSSARGTENSGGGGGGGGGLVPSSPRDRAIAVQCTSVLVLLYCARWVWTDGSSLDSKMGGLPHASSEVPAGLHSGDVLRQVYASTTLGWMFVFEALGQVGLIIASSRHVAAEDPGRGDLSSGLPSTTSDVEHNDIRVDFHVWMRSEDAVKRWSSFLSYLSFIVLVSFCRFQLAGQAMDADLLGSRHSLAMQLAAIFLFAPQVVGACVYIIFRQWPAKWYGAIVFLLCPFFAGGAMLSRFSNGVDRDGDQAFWGAVVLVGYMAPFMVYTLGEPHVQRWHLEVMSLVVWALLALFGRSMML